jgi:hypothetical protein
MANTSKTVQMSKLLSRKFLLTSLVIVIAIILVVLDKITGSEFLGLITANIGLYNASNALSKGKME